MRAGRGIMPSISESGSRRILGRLKETMAEPAEGQVRLNNVVRLIAAEMGTDVCSVYLFRDEETLELCATEGLNQEAVHQTRMRLGEGLVGRVAKRTKPVNTADAPAERGFRYMPETGEEIFSAFLNQKQYFYILVRCNFFATESVKVFYDLYLYIYDFFTKKWTVIEEERHKYMCAQKIPHFMLFRS